MPERKIHCSDCNLYLGTIRDATLRKGITHVCESCESKRKSAKAMDYLNKIIKGNTN